MTLKLSDCNLYFLALLYTLLRTKNIPSDKNENKEKEIIFPITLLTSITNHNDFF